MATWLLESGQGVVLTNRNKRERLVSFYHLLTIKEKLKSYIKNGINQ